MKPPVSPRGLPAIEARLGTLGERCWLLSEDLLALVTEINRERDRLKGAREMEAELSEAHRAGAPIDLDRRSAS